MTGFSGIVRFLLIAALTAGNQATLPARILPWHPDASGDRRTTAPVNLRAALTRGQGDAGVSQTPTRAIAAGLSPPPAPGCTAATTITTSNTDVAAIPDKSTIVQTLVVAGLTGVIWDVDLVTAISHTYPGDLDVTLTSPAGTTVTITTDNGAGNDNVFNGTRWDDSGTEPVTDAVYVANVVKPDLAPEEPLQALRGQNPNGTWRLTISDGFAGDTGTLQGWSVVVATVPALPPEVTSPAFEAAPDLAIPDNNAQGITSPLAVAGTGRYLTGLELRTSIPHTFPDDLDIVLTSPSGKVVIVSTDNGGSNANAFNGTVWRDNAGTPVGDLTYAPDVVIPLATPEQPFSSLIGDDPNGTWTLTVRDDESAAVGRLVSWSLFVTTGACLNPTPTDSDGDGLPNSWEREFGLSTSAAFGPNGADGDPDADGLSNAEELQAGSHPRGFFTRYFAEGATGTFFDMTLALANFTDSSPGTTLLRFNRTDGLSVGQLLTVPPQRRTTVDPEKVPGFEAAEFSTVIESDVPIVADRTMLWDQSHYGSHAEAAVVSPLTTWYLAEGATHSGFDLFYLVQNANDAAVDVEVRYLLPAPAAPIVRTYSVAARSRFNIWVDLEPGLDNTDVSAVITATRPVIVERAMYLTSAGRTFSAGHESAGTTPSRQWLFAEGATGSFFDLFILLANPNSETATVTATYLLPSGNTIVKSYTVAGNSRSNIWVDLEDPALEDTAVSTTISSSIPIVAERAMWWPGPTAASWAEAHDSAGAKTTGTEWALAEGEVGGADAVETYILISNTSNTEGTASVRLVFPESFSERTYVLPPTSRTTIPVQLDFPESQGRRFGAVVRSVGSPAAQIVVERSMYSDSGGVVWAAGTNALGQPVVHSNSLVITAPAAIAGTYALGGSSFGQPFPGAGITAGVVLANDNVGIGSDACQPLVNGMQVVGNIALVDSGSCSFPVKVQHAQDAGAIAVLVVSDQPLGIGSIDGASPAYSVPSGMISLGTGTAIKAALPGVTATVRAQ